jgi:hypothetical protein
MCCRRNLQPRPPDTMARHLICRTNRPGWSYRWTYIVFAGEREVAHGYAATLRLARIAARYVGT